MLALRCALPILALTVSSVALAQNADRPKDEPKLDTSRGDAMIADYFRRETQKLADACLADIQSADDWNARKDEYRRQLREMLGLDPLPEKTDLMATVTGKLDHDEFTVEKLHFQSRPGLYVTGNLYVPKASGGRQPPGGTIADPDRGADAPRSEADPLAERVDHIRYPAILYVCGHGNVKKDGISYGAKSHYQHHGAWFARNGYVCLVIDTLQLGEIEGIHHGTYRYGMWWWLNRGYTPAGVEAWNCVRALDYLQSRPEVDPEKLGVTGRSGGGAYSWWIAAIDERIKCAVPVAGITDLQNHVVDGCVEGHCDCMYMVNTYRWDYPQVAALVAPRPLLISNTDSDGIFPLDGVVRVFDKARRIYTLLGKRDQIGLNITSGGHKDTQELQVTALRWFNHHLRGYDGPVTNHAEKLFEPEQLKVFDTLPEDQINTKIHESFVAAAEPPKVPESKEEWVKMREGWMKQVKEKCFRGWPDSLPPLEIKLVREASRDKLRLQVIEFTAEQGIRLEAFVVRSDDERPLEQVLLVFVDDPGWENFLRTMRAGFAPELDDYEATDVNEAFYSGIKNAAAGPTPFGYVVAPLRGIGPHRWDQSEKKQVQHRRRFMLLGETLESSQAWDARRAIAAVSEFLHVEKSIISVDGRGALTAPLLWAAILEPEVKNSILPSFDLSRITSAALLNVDRVAGLDPILALALESTPIQVQGGQRDNWRYPQSLGKVLGWDKARLNTDSLPLIDGIR